MGGGGIFFSQKSPNFNLGTSSIQGGGSQFFKNVPISIILQLFCNITFIRNVGKSKMSEFDLRGNKFGTKYTGYFGGWWRRGSWSENKSNPRGVWARPNPRSQSVTQFFKMMVGQDTHSGGGCARGLSCARLCTCRETTKTRTTSVIKTRSGRTFLYILQYLISFTGQF